MTSKFEIDISSDQNRGDLLYIWDYTTLLNRDSKLQWLNHEKDPYEPTKRDYNNIISKLR